MKTFLLACSVLVAFTGLGQVAKAANIEVGTCVEFATCYSGQTPTAFSDVLTSSDLISLGLGSTKALFVVQTSPFIIRLGETTFDFTTLTGMVTETLPEFNGPGSFTTQVLTVGDVFIPANATSATVMGTFGNSTIPNSAGADVFFGISSVPLPASAPLFGAALLALGGLGYGMKRKQAAV